MKTQQAQILKFFVLLGCSMGGLFLFITTNGTLLKAIVIFAIFTVLKIMANVAYHRWLAHRYIDPVPVAKFFLLYSIVCGALVSPVKYVIGHRLHHRYSDTERDPHSPKIGYWNNLLGNFNEVNFNVNVRDVYSMKEVLFVERHFYSLYFLNLLILSIMDVHLLFLSFLFMNMHQLISVTTFNYLAHGGSSNNRGPRNLGLIFTILMTLFGEQLHKNHHDDPSRPFYGRINALNFDWMYYLLKYGFRIKTKSL